MLTTTSVRAALFGALLAASASGQSPLVTLSGGTNGGNPGGGVYFDLQVSATMTLTQIDVRCGANSSTGASVIELYLGPSTYFGNLTSPASWALVATGSGTVGPSLVANFVFGTPFALGPGNYGVALKSVASTGGGNVQWGFGYTNGATCSNTTIPGSCANSVFANADMTLRAGAAQNAFLAGSIFSPRIFNGAIHYALGGSPIALASWANFGTGCYRRRTSFYEFFPSSAGVDVSNTTLQMVFAGDRYVVVATGSPFVAPTGSGTVLTFANGNAASVFSALPFPIPYPNGGSTAVASAIEIHADGFINPVPAANSWSSPNVAGFNSGATRWCPHWKNMDVTAGGTVTVEVETVSGALVVSWNNVVDNGQFSTFQTAFHPSGTVEYRYGGMSTGGGGSAPALIGWAHGAQLDNPIDLSVSSSSGFTTDPTDSSELSQTMNARPLLGTTPSLLATNLPWSSVFGFSLLDYAQIPGGFELSSLGAPGCRLYLVSTQVAQLMLASGNTLTQAIQIPLAPMLIGSQVFAQMAAFAPGQNTLGLVWSNGTAMTIGSF